ncbi:glucose 1-dehydrogenase [soil metagenome]
MPQDLTTKIAIVTGAARGLGAAQVEALILEGATVFATDLGAFEEAPERNEPRLIQRSHDVTNEEQWHELSKEVLDRHGRIDILVNNAGYFQPGTVEETTGDLMDIHYRVNQLGTFFGIAAVIPAMKEQGSGSIINISSLAGMRGVGGQFAYAASKWASRGMTKCAASDLGRYGIRVNSVHPGMIDTPMLRRNTPDMLGKLSSLIPSGHFGQPSDVAKVVAFLASDASAYMNGAELTVDAGAGL